MKRKPTAVGPFEFPIKFNIDLEIPEKPDVEIKGKITIPPVKAGEMVLEHL